VATIEIAWRELTAVLAGEVVLPRSPRYDEVRKPPIPRFHDVRPQAVALLDEFVSVAGAHPASLERSHMRYGSLKNYLAERGPGDQEDEDGRPYMKSEFSREPQPAGAVEALVELFVGGRRPGEARKLDFMPWGGAYNRMPADATAFPHREELFLLEHSVVVPAGFDEAATAAARAWLSDSWELVHPSGSGGVYANFPDLDLPDEHRAYWGGNLERVRRVKVRSGPAQHPPGSATPEAAWTSS
jgi:hypothetical protein